MSHRLSAGEFRSGSRVCLVAQPYMCRIACAELQPSDSEGVFGISQPLPKSMGITKSRTVRAACGDGAVELEVLRSESPVGFLARRSLLLNDGSRIEVFVPFRDIEAFAGFVRCEPIAELQRKARALAPSLVHNDGAMRASGQGRPALSAHDLLASGQRVMAAPSVMHLDAELRAVCESLGACGYVVTLGQINAQGPLGALYLLVSAELACWAQEYVARRWFLIDPMLQALKRARLPVRGTTLERQSVGQRAHLGYLRTVGLAAELGIGSAAQSAWLGVDFGGLLLRAAGDAATREREMAQSSTVLQGLAAHATEWWLRENIRREAGTVTLTQQEFAVLRDLGTGTPVRDIAPQLGLSETAVRESVRRAREKVGAKNAAQAWARVSELAALRQFAWADPAPERGADQLEAAGAIGARDAGL